MDLSCWFFLNKILFNNQQINFLKWIDIPFSRGWFPPSGQIWILYHLSYQGSLFKKKKKLSNQQINFQPFFFSITSIKIHYIYIYTHIPVPVQSFSRVWLSATPWTVAPQASLSITKPQSPPKPMSIESVMPSNHLILCRPLLLPPSIFPSIRVFSNESALHIMLP